MVSARERLAQAKQVAAKKKQDAAAASTTKNRERRRSIQLEPLPESVEPPPEAPVQSLVVAAVLAEASPPVAPAEPQPEQQPAVQQPAEPPLAKQQPTVGALEVVLCSPEGTLTALTALNREASRLETLSRAHEQINNSMEVQLGQLTELLGWLKQAQTEQKSASLVHKVAQIDVQLDPELKVHVLAACLGTCAGCL